MFCRLCLTVILGVASAFAQPATPQTAPSAAPTIPDTPTGRTFRVWLDSFNRGDRATMEAYYHKYEPDKSVEPEIHFRDVTGGFDLVKIMKSEPLHLEFLVKEHHSDTQALGEVEVKEGDPAVVTGFALRAIPPGTSLASLNFTIDAATRARVIDGAITNLNQFYVFPDTAKKMEEAVRARQRKGEYDAISDGNAFAKMLTDNLQAVSHDKHLRVDFSPAPMPEHPEGPPDANARAQYRKQMERMNCGFDKVEILSGNVGYLKFDMFADPDACGPTAIAAMNFLANVDAIIFDMRENGGGDPKMVAFISICFLSPLTSTICGSVRTTAHTSIGLCPTCQESAWTANPRTC